MWYVCLILSQDSRAVLFCVCVINEVGMKSEGGVAWSTQQRVHSLMALPSYTLWCNCGSRWCVCWGGGATLVRLVNVCGLWGLSNKHIYIVRHIHTFDLVKPYIYLYIWYCHLRQEGKAVININFFLLTQTVTSCLRTTLFAHDYTS